MMLMLLQKISRIAGKSGLVMRVLPSLLLACVQSLANIAPASSNALAPTIQTTSVKYEATVPTTWFELYLDLIKDTKGFTPPVASRAFGYAGVTLYEALVPGIPGYQSLAGQLNELPPLPQPSAGQTYHWPIVANSALARMTHHLFANTSKENLTAIEVLEQRFVDEFEAELNPAILHRSIEQGRAVAEAIYAWSRTDHGHEGYLTNFPSDYITPSGTGLWVSTPPNFDSALQPYWGQNRPFVLKSGAECASGPPPAYSEDPASAFYQEAMEVYETVSNLMPEQKEIAMFWADNPGETATPPGHSISILTQVLKQERATLDVAAEAYAKVGIAVADAFITCWSTKYQYNLIRPVSYIQQVVDPNWSPLVVTPPFPEYTSGHSVQSAAAAQVLTDLFGEKVSFTDHIHDDRGLASRSFNSFFEFAGEAALSRLYGGIHYRSAIETGIKQGKCIGRQVSALKFSRIAMPVGLNASTVVCPPYAASVHQAIDVAQDGAALCNPNGSFATVGLTPRSVLILDMGADNQIADEPGIDFYY